MNNPFQDQFLKAGIATKQQVNKAKKHKQTANKQQRSNKKLVTNENEIKAQLKAKQKADKDRELNQKKQLQAKQKATSIEIDKLINDNKVKRDKGCDIAYNYQHRNKVNKIYVNEEMKQKIVSGQLGIARIEGRYELIPKLIAEKIQQRNDKRIILLDSNAEKEHIEEQYADYEIPDDLMW